MGLKKSARRPTTYLGIYYLSVLVFLIITSVDSSFEDRVVLPIFLLALPIPGMLLMMWGFHLIIRGGFEGLIPAPIVGLAVILGGIAMAFAFPFYLFSGTEGLSALRIARGILGTTLVPPLAVATVVIHGGSELVRGEALGRALTSFRERLSQRFLDT